MRPFLWYGFLGALAATAGYMWYQQQSPYSYGGWGWRGLFIGGNSQQQNVGSNTVFQGTGGMQGSNTNNQGLFNVPHVGNNQQQQQQWWQQQQQAGNNRPSPNYQYQYNNANPQNWLGGSRQGPYGGGGNLNWNSISFANGNPYYLVATTDSSSVSANCPGSICKVLRADANGGQASNTNPPYAVPTSFILTQNNSNGGGNGGSSCLEFAYGTPQNGNNGNGNSPIYNIQTFKVCPNGPNSCYTPNNGGSEATMIILATGSVTNTAGNGYLPLSTTYSWLAVGLNPSGMPVSRTNPPTIWVLSSSPQPIIQSNAWQQINQALQNLGITPRLVPVNPICQNIYSALSGRTRPSNGYNNNYNNYGNSNYGSNSYGYGYGYGGGRANVVVPPTNTMTPGITSAQYWQNLGSQVGNNLANQATGTVNNVVGQATSGISNIANQGTQAATNVIPAVRNRNNQQQYNNGYQQLQQQQGGLFSNLGFSNPMSNTMNQNNWASQSLAAGLGINTRGDTE